MSSIETARELILAERLIAIVRVAHPADWIPATLEAAGVRVFELSLTSGDALATLDRWSKQPGEAMIGAGTVLSVENAQRAVDAGARYLVSPGFDPALYTWACENDILHIPGVLTPTEVTHALAAGAKLLKLFPAVPLGPDYIRQLRGPFPEAHFVATGGVDETNGPAFLAAGAAAVGIGGAVVRNDWRTEEVAARAARIAALIRSAVAA